MSAAVLELIKQGDAAIRLIHAPQQPNNFKENSPLNKHLERELEQLNNPRENRPINKLTHATVNDRKLYHDQLSNTQVSRNVIADTRPPCNEQHLIDKSPALSVYWEVDRDNKVLLDNNNKPIPKPRGIYTTRGGQQNTIFTKKKSCYLLAPHGLVKHYEPEELHFIPVGFLYDVKALHLKGERYIFDKDPWAHLAPWTGPQHDDTGSRRIGHAGAVVIRKGIIPKQSHAKSLWLKDLKADLATKALQGIIPEANTMLVGLSKQALQALFATQDNASSRLNLLRVAILAQSNPKYCDKGRYNFSLLVLDGKKPPYIYDLPKIKQDIISSIECIRNYFTKKMLAKLLVGENGILELLYGQEFSKQQIYNDIRDPKQDVNAVATQILNATIKYTINNADSLIEIIKNNTNYSDTAVINIIDQYQGNLSDFSEYYNISPLMAAITYNRGIDVINKILAKKVDINAVDALKITNALELTERLSKPQIKALLVQHGAKYLNNQQPSQSNNIKTFADFYTCMQNSGYLQYVPKAFTETGLQGFVQLIKASLIYILDKKLANYEFICQTMINKKGSIPEYINYLHNEIEGNSMLTDVEKKALAWLSNRQAPHRTNEFNTIDLKKLDALGAQGNYNNDYNTTGTYLLFNIKPNTIHYRDLRDAFFPQAPIIHPYNLTGNDLQHDSNARINYGLPKFPVVAKIPTHYSANLPPAVLTALKAKHIDPKACELYFATQDMPWQKEQLLFRPHYCLHNDNPGNSSNISSNAAIAIYDPNNKITLERQNNTQFANFDFSSHTSNCKGLICSPNNCKINGDDPKTTTHFYSIIIPQNSNKAIITLHWLLNDQDTYMLEQIANIKKLNSQQDTIYDFAKLLNDFIAAYKQQTNKDLTIPNASLQTLLNLQLTVAPQANPEQGSTTSLMPDNPRDSMTFAALYDKINNSTLLKKCMPSVFFSQQNTKLAIKQSILKGFEALSKEKFEDHKILTLMIITFMKTRNQDSQEKYQQHIMQTAEVATAIEIEFIRALARKALSNKTISSSEYENVQQQIKSFDLNLTRLVEKLETESDKQSNQPGSPKFQFH